MAFNWPQFLASHNIEYVTSGPNVSRGNIAIKCPFCGSADQGQHLGISLEGKGWGCWRSSAHRGKSDAKLVSALLHCDLASAHTITGTSTIFLPDDFLGRVKAALGENQPRVHRPAAIDMPASFYPLQSKPSARPYRAYLSRRGFRDWQIDRLTEWYGLHYCTRGPFHGRIIFPVCFEGKLISWTGRTIYADHPLRYRSLSDDPAKATLAGLPCAAGSIKDYILWYDELCDSDAESIFIVEGPFDALKINVLGRSYGIVATCLFTAAMSSRQADLLHALLPRFRHRYSMLDDGMFHSTMRIAADLRSLGVEPRALPKRVKDPGDLTEDQLLEIGA